MKRTGFARKPAPERPRQPIVPVVRCGVVRRVSDEVTVFPKDGEFRSEAWRRAVASLPCVRCFKDGPSQCAHANHRGKGLAFKAPDVWSFPMCPDCHRDFDQGATLTKAQKREFADEWILLTIRALVMKGLVVAK